ncbi:aminotransferase class IV [Mariprofundus ferrooxydans]|uniref:aminotransferase class IV n=1 Tax=Mariprofundus ferrooxydans TaxID=314344 RepID=UPI0003783854|nr:aminotransferase class IV [Mariprofundus ferrooxydans]
MTLTAWVNGRFLPLAEACVNVEDRGFQFADGVYEMLVCFAGVFVDLEAHLSRLQHSCDTLAIPFPLPAEEMKAVLHEAYSRNPFDHAMVYIQITRGVAPRAHRIDTIPKPTMVITVRELPEPSVQQVAHGATAITRPDIRWKRCDIKSIALLANVMGKQEAAQLGADECFWQDERESILEGCSSNALALINGTLVTHPLDHQVLGGIARSMILRLAAEHDIPVEERAWRLDENGLSECMMCSTTDAVMPVCHINGHAVCDGKPGPVSMMLRQAMLDEFNALRQTRQEIAS